MAPWRSTPAWGNPAGDPLRLLTWLANEGAHSLGGLRAGPVGHHRFLHRHRAGGARCRVMAGWVVLAAPNCSAFEVGHSACNGHLLVLKSIWPLALDG